MKNKYTGLAVSLALAFAFIALVAFSLLLASTPTQAAPPSAPTPVADFLMPLKNAAAFPLQSATAITADTNTTGVEVMNMSAVDVQYIIDHGTLNTTTLKIQYSNDNSNWVDGITLVSASAADGTSITRVPVFGRWIRVNQDVATTDTITITVLAVGR